MIGRLRSPGAASGPSIGLVGTRRDHPIEIRAGLRRRDGNPCTHTRLEAHELGTCSCAATRVISARSAYGAMFPRALASQRAPSTGRTTGLSTGHSSLPRPPGLAIAPPGPGAGTSPRIRTGPIERKAAPRAPTAGLVPSPARFATRGRVIAAGRRPGGLVARHGRFMHETLKQVSRRIAHFATSLDSVARSPSTSMTKLARGCAQHWRRSSRRCTAWMMRMTQATPSRPQSPLGGRAPRPRAGSENE